MYRYFAGSRPDGRCVLVRFDRDPRTNFAAIGDRYINNGGSWVPDTTGLLGDRSTTKARTQLRGPARIIGAPRSTVYLDTTGTPPAETA